MTALLSQQCKNLSGTNNLLSDDEINKLLQQLKPLWALDTINKTISHRYAFNDYDQTMAFANIVAQIAHQQNHHPELLIRYDRCTVTYTTHSVNGLSINDFICAAKINAAQNL